MKYHFKEIIMKTTLSELMTKPIEWIVTLGVWVDNDGNIYQLADKTIADTVEFELIAGSDFEYTAASNKGNNGNI